MAHLLQYMYRKLDVANKQGSAMINQKLNAVSVNPPQKLLIGLLEHYQSARFKDAEELAQKIIQDFPEHQFSWKMLAAVFKATGRKSKAVVASQKAVELFPQDAEAHSHLGVVLKEVGRLDEAKRCFKKALSLKSDYVEAHYNLGLTLREFMELDEAAECFKRAIALKPNVAEAHNNLGITLQEVGKFQDAEVSYNQAIMLNPYYAEAHSNLAVNLKKQGRLEESEVSCKRAIELKPGFVEAHNNLGGTLQELGKFDEAEASYNQAILLKPDFADAHSNLGVTLQELGRFNEAEASYNLAILLKPDFADAHSNLGVTLQELGRFQEAEASFNQAVAYKPDFAEAYSRLGVVLYIQGDGEAALAACEKANKLRDDLPNNKTTLAILKAKTARGITGLSFGNTGNQGSGSKQFKKPVILDRIVERELISSLYKMKSIELEKFDNSRSSDPRFGDGKCSQDFELFSANSPIIRSVAQDLTIIMSEAVNSDIHISESFFNIFGSGGGTTPHAHLSKLDQNRYLNFGKQKYSLVYYVSVGDQNCKDPGILKLYDPSEDILPTEGMIAIFPAGRRHSSIYGGKKDRIMIGANFYSL